MQILTIGGYGFTEAGFLSALQRAGVDLFVDIRQRRGMRGAKYAFLNSSRLQSLLSKAGIKYMHAIDLAPTPSVRDAQKEDDRASGVAKRDRSLLSSIFVEKYRSEILGRFDGEALKRALRDAKAVVLFCVESQPSACHRSLAAEHLIKEFGNLEPVQHLQP